MFRIKAGENFSTGWLVVEKLVFALLRVTQVGNARCRFATVTHHGNGDVM
jgi:hypothetical protein